MCLAIPMKLTKITGQEGVVELSGTETTISLQLLEHPRVGEYVIVHAGFAISRLSPEEAEETLKLLSEVEDAGKKAAGNKTLRRPR